MKSNWHFSILLLLLLTACLNGEHTYEVDYTNMLCGGNSKVWELDLSKTSVNEAPVYYSWGKVLFVFYHSGKVLVGSVNKLSQSTCEKGKFSYSPENHKLTLFVNHEVWEFDLTLDENGGLWLQTIKGKGLSKYLHLLPLREPA